MAPQLPVAAQEIAVIPAEPPVFSAGSAGSPAAEFQVPPVSPITKAWACLLAPST